AVSGRFSRLTSIPSRLQSRGEAERSGEPLADGITPPAFLSCSTLPPIAIRNRQGVKRRVSKRKGCKSKEIESKRNGFATRPRVTTASGNGAPNLLRPVAVCSTVAAATALCSRDGRTTSLRDATLPPLRQRSAGRNDPEGR